jgi:hypothetical protein
MAQWYLIGDTRVGTQTYYAGDLVDDAITPTATLQSAGAVLWPASDPVMAKAAALAQKMRLGGQDSSARTVVMLQAVAQNTLNLMQGKAGVGGFRSGGFGG